MKTDASDIDVWMAQLPGRIESGELAASGPIDWGPDAWMASAEVAARILLADLDRLHCLPSQRRGDASIQRRRIALLSEILRLRVLIGE
jgi:hypothetical protein